MDVSGYLEPTEIRKIINAVVNCSKHPDRDQLLFELLWQSGCRVTEGITLVPEHVGNTSVILSNLKQVKRVKGPNGKSTRVHDPRAIKEVEVTEALCERLKLFATTNEIYPGQWLFFGNRSKADHVGRHYIWEVMNRASENAQVYHFGKRHPNTGGRFKGAFPHLFRHSNAVHLLEQTSDVMLVKEQLGHASVVSTQAYTTVKKPKIRRAIRTIDWGAENGDVSDNDKRPE